MSFHRIACAGSARQRFRNLVREQRCRRNDDYPIYVCPGENVRKEIAAMPDRSIFDRQCGENRERGGAACRVELFPLLPKEMTKSTRLLRRERDYSIRLRAIARMSGLLLVTDICMCEYTSHGHCGVTMESRTTPVKLLPIQLWGVRAGETWWRRHDGRRRRDSSVGR
jgi:porphobilinogen synthase